MAMWAALEGVTHTTPLRNGVLIIFSKNLKGRIGIFCNRYISGAVIEPGGQTGLDAVRELLSIKGGMFGFRATMGDESKELAQSLGLDISELMLSKSSEGATAGEALGALMAPGSQLLRASDLGGSEVSDDAENLAEGDELPDGEDAAAEDGSEDGSFSYLDWFADQMGEPDILPKIRQILLPALPRIMDPAQAPAEPVHHVSNDLEMYGKLLQTEQDKVTKDIERSLERGRAAKNGDDAVGELKLLSEFIQSEQARAEQWNGLDQIPTPSSTSTSRPDHQAIRKPNLRGTGEYNKDCGDLLATSQHRISVPKDFVSKKSLAAAPKIKRFFDVDRLRDKRVIGVACISILIMLIVGITTVQSNSAMETSLTQAKKALQDKQADRAIFILNNAIEKDPTSSRAFFYRGLAYATSGDYDHAKLDFEAAMLRGAPQARVLLARASAACKAEQYEEAIQDCNDLLKMEPKNLEAMLILTTSFERQRDYDGIEKIATQAIGITDDPAIKAHLLVQRGFARTRQRKHADAGHDFGQAIVLKPDASTYMQRGDAYRSLKRWGVAVSDYSQVIAKDPRRYEAYVARGICYGALHEDKSAMKDFGRALSLDKAGVEAYIQRGSLHLSRSNYRLAANDLEDAIKLLPNDTETQQKLAAAYTHLHRAIPRAWLRGVTNGSASSTSSRSMISDAQPDTVGSGKMPSDPKQLVSVGYKYLTNGEIQYAIQMFAEAIKKQPNNVEARRYMAHALVESGSAATAISQFEALVSLDALTPADALIYSKALSNTRNTERAVDVLTNYLTRSPKNISLRAELTRLYLSIGFGTKAESAYREGLTYVRTAADKALLDSAYRNAGGTQRVSPGAGKVKDSDLGG